ncbi:dihydrofolate reductase family protein [Naasia sp. SYSU D00057]|uniref:dihydrofolate reductase family protein n=1 Tax=Naasia sp. SYSU D00057 TaxID=2817380 RepID=UPI001B310386|nr:dihydrofolate reductase family protein [Naasia sp. SYSU D00057]
MRKLVVSMITSLDGYHEGPGRDVMAMPFDDAFSPHNLERLRSADTLLLGRRGYEGFAGYWSRVAEDPTEPPLEREIAARNRDLEKVVISDTLRVGPRAPWATTTRVVRRADAVAEVTALKSGEGGDILVFGSAITWNPLLEAGLVDELDVLVGPALLGDGTKLYSGARAPLRLLEARVLPDSQLVLLRYDASGVDGDQGR